MKNSQQTDDPKPSAAFKVGAIALVFLIIGYQAALFIYKASVSAIVAHHDRPDTVFVVDRSLAEKVLAVGQDPAGSREDDAGPGNTRAAASGSGREPGRVVIRREAPHTEEARATQRQFVSRRIESFPFNPNTASQDDFIRLGFSEKQAQALIHYREKGGRFRRKEDFARSFVVADSVYERLEPYIRIPRVDLNVADSAAFDALPGIGPFYAGKMVSYRTELGGYSYPEQLMDLWKFDREKYNAIADLITVSHPYHYPLWTMPEDSLKLHPYIRKYAAHGIVLFREGSPASEWTVANLAKAGILKPEQAAKLARCVESQ